MDVTPGSRLGPYEIVSRLGAGGMGEVFRAKDTRLDRSVAIKVLPEELARNAQFKVRFEREAKAISQLNHPNICTLYDVGDDYLVMELLEGENLAERVAKGPLPIGDVLRFGAQIADALDRAHRAGIVHRDLKPANVMITKSGAKLLDFGLAKSSGMTVDPHGETVHHDRSLTQEGTILGTFQYMAPEQLEAEEADARTDIFALGAVLYEMATGKRAFAGKTKTSLIAAIVGAQPQPISQLIPLTPPALDHVIQKCLEKERDDRWQSAHDVAEELKWIAATPLEEKVKTARSAKLATAAAILLALALAGVSAMWLRARNAPKPRTAFQILPPDGFRFGSHILSPDGTMVAFNTYSNKDEGGLWLRRLGEIESKRLTANLEDYPMAWSPDSKWIAYASVEGGGRSFKKISVNGGAPEVLRAKGTQTTGSVAWNAEGTMVYARVFGEGLIALPPDGGDPRPLTTIDGKRRESFHGWPQFLADDHRFLYVVHTVAEQKNEIWAGSLDGKLKTMVMRADSLVGVALEHIYFVRDGSIYAQPFDEESLKLSGAPKRMADRVLFEEPAISALAFVGSNGAILYRPVMERTIEFGWYDRTGRRIEKVFEEVDSYPRSMSRDGTRIAATKFNPAKGADDIYLIDLVRGIRTKLTSGLSHNLDPVWSHDGATVYFVSDRDGTFNLYAQAEDGATPAVPIWISDRDKAIFAASPSGDILLTGHVSAETRGDIWIVPVANPEKRRQLVATEANESQASFSPDGKWVAYVSDRSGRQELYIRRLEGGRTTQVSTTGTNGYAWSRISNEIFLRRLDNSRVLIPIDLSGSEAVPGKATPLFTAPSPDYAIIAVTEKGLGIWTVPDPSDYISLLNYDSAPAVQ